MSLTSWLGVIQDCTSRYITMTFYMSAIITIALSCIISEIKRDISPKIAIYAYRNYNGLATKI